MEIDIQENKNNIVVKQNDLVWQARYKLSELGIKVVAVLISMIKKDDEDFKEYNLKLSDFKELIGSSSHKTYEYVDVMTDELMKKPFKIGDEKFNWVYYARYHKGDSYVTLKIAPELKPYLLQIQGKYLRYDIINILPLKSCYIIRFYELLKSKWSEYKHYNKRAKSYEFEIGIDWLREHFDIPNSYQYSSHIKERILEKAKTQLMETDIHFTYKEKKLGRKVDKIIITIKPNKVAKNNSMTKDKEIVKKVDMNTVHTSIVCLQGIDNVATTDYYEEYTDGSCSIILKSGNKVFLRDKTEDITHNKYLWDMIKKG